MVQKMERGDDLNNLRPTLCLSPLFYLSRVSCLPASAASFDLVGHRAVAFIRRLHPSSSSIGAILVPDRLLRVPLV